MAAASFSKVVNECLDKVVQESLGGDFCLSINFKILSTQYAPVFNVFIRYLCWC